MIDYWEQKLRAEAEFLPSLQNFNTKFMSLTTPHPIWETAGSNPYEVAKAVVQARMLSGRYRTELLCRHWSKNKHGLCLSSTCTEIEETLEHILLWCPAYTITRQRLMALWYSTENEAAFKIITEVLNGTPQSLLQFILDCSTIPMVISSSQVHGPSLLSTLFYLSRTWCHSIHRSRLKLLGRWNFF